MVPVASMGDIAFLLIIFFVLAARFSEDSGIKIERAKSEDIVKIEEHPPVSIMMDGDGQLWVDGAEVTKDNLLTSVEERLVGYEQERRRLLVTFDANLTYADFEPIAEILAQLNAPLMMAGQLDVNLTKTHVKTRKQSEN
jgi:biopolymer transport protein ExbD